jgi:hypothetical protein
MKFREGSTDGSQRKYSETILVAGILKGPISHTEGTCPVIRLIGRCRFLRSFTQRLAPLPLVLLAEALTRRLRSQ